jgi:hypothetical protein
VLRKGFLFFAFFALLERVGAFKLATLKMKTNPYSGVFFAMKGLEKNRADSAKKPS